MGDAERPRDRRRGATAVVLVAGCGSRLAAASGPTKCLTDVCGRTLLDRQMSMLERVVERVVLVVGHERPAVEAALAALAVTPAVTVVENARFRQTGTLTSLGLGLSAVPGDHDLLIVEGDVLFVPQILDRVLVHRGASAAAVARWRPEFSGTAAVVRGGRVAGWVHETRRPPGFMPDHHYKTVNITLLARDAWQSRLRPALEHVSHEAGERAPLEYAMQRVVTADPDLVHAVPVDGCDWWEIDTPEDLRMARALCGQPDRAL